jgi:hypothetical protein
VSLWRIGLLAYWLVSLLAGWLLAGWVLIVYLFNCLTVYLIISTLDHYTNLEFIWLVGLFPIAIGIGL